MLTFGFRWDNGTNSYVWATQSYHNIIQNLSQLLSSSPETHAYIYKTILQIITGDSTGRSSHSHYLNYQWKLQITSMNNPPKTSCPHLMPETAESPWPPWTRDKCSTTFPIFTKKSSENQSIKPNPVLVPSFTLDWELESLGLNLNSSVKGMGQSWEKTHEKKNPLKMLFY